MACTTITSNPTDAGFCLRYVQKQLGLPTCGDTAIDALNGCGYGAGSDSPGMLVFFSGGPQGFGHVGVVGSGNQFTSELSDGSVATCDINDFAAANGMSIAGYRNPGVSGGSVPSALPFPSGQALLVGGGVILAALVLYEYL